MLYIPLIFLDYLLSIYYQAPQLIHCYLKGSFLLVLLVLDLEILREYEEKESNLNIVNVKHQDDGNVLIRYISNDENILENSKLTKANLEDFYLWTFPEDRSFKVN